MPRLSKKTMLIREVARQAAEKMAAEGDRSILDAAEQLASEVKWVSVDGALEVFFCAALHEMQSEDDGDRDRACAAQRVLDRYNREAKDE